MPGDEHKDPPQVELKSIKRRRMTTAQLLGMDKELLIVHGEAEYVLRITKHGKLILTK